MAANPERLIDSLLRAELSVREDNLARAKKEAEASREKGIVEDYQDDVNNILAAIQYWNVARRGMK
jgi:hypothetical protein